MIYLCVDCQPVNILTEENILTEIRKDIIKLSNKLEEVMNFQKNMPLLKGSVKKLPNLS